MASQTCYLTTLSLDSIQKVLNRQCLWQKYLPVNIFLTFLTFLNQAISRKLALISFNWIDLFILSLVFLTQLWLLRMFLVNQWDCLITWLVCHYWHWLFALVSGALIDFQLKLFPCLNEPCRYRNLSMFFLDKWCVRQNKKVWTFFLYLLSVFFRMNNKFWFPAYWIFVPGICVKMSGIFLCFSPWKVFCLF